MSKKLFQVVRRRAFVSAILLILLSCGIFFRHPLLKLSVVTYCNLQVPVEGGWKFTYRDISLSTKGINVDGALLEANDHSFSYFCDHIHLYAKHKVGAKFDVHLDMPHSKVTFQQIEGAIPVSPDILWNILQKPVHLQLEEGELELITRNERTLIYFSLFGEKSSGALGTIFLSSENDTEPEAMVKCYRWPNEKIIKFEADQCKLFWLSKFVTFFDILDTSSWNISEGKLGGNLWLGWKDEKDLSQLTARLRMEEFAAVDKEHGLDLTIKGIECDLSFPSGKRLKEDIKWSPLQNLALTTKVDEGRIGFKDLQRGSEFAICDIGGVVCLNSLNHSEISLKGFLEQQGHLDPIVIAGNPSLIDPNSLKLDLKLLLEPNHETKLGISIAFTEDDNCIIKGQLKELSTEQVSMFQHILGFAYPEIKEVEFAEGTVTCEMSLMLGKERMQKLYLDQLACDNLQIFVRSNDILAFCSHLAGSAEIDLTVLPSIQFPHWEIQVEKGDVVIGRGEKSSLAFADIDLDVCMSKDAFDLSKVSFTYEGIFAECEIIGECEKPNLLVNMAFDGERLFQLATGNWISLPNFSPYRFFLGTSFIRSDAGWEASGSLEMAHKQKDTFNYEFFLKDDIYRANFQSLPELFKKCISNGRFSAENVSLEASNFASYFSKVNWGLSGEVSLDGVFSTEKIAMDISTSEYQLNSEFGEVIHHGPEIHGSITYDIEKKLLRGHLPAFLSQFHEKSMGISYRDINADVFFDKDTLSIDGIRTEVEGMILEGSISLDFSPLEAPKLLIDVEKALGTTKQLENFVRHFPNFKPINLPFDGQITLDEGAFHLECHLGKNDAIWLGNMHVQHGSYQMSKNHSLSDIEFFVFYNSLAKECILSKFQAKIPTLELNREYRLHVPTLRILDSSGTFDARIENGLMDIARFAGEFDSTNLFLSLNSDKSHLFGNPLQDVYVSCSREYLLDEAELKVGISLSELKHAQTLLTDFGILNTKILGPQDCFGLLDLHLCLNEGVWKAEALGSSISLCGNQVEKCLFQGEKINSSWKINTMQFGDLGIKGAFFQDKKTFTVDLLKFDHPKYLATFQGGEIHLDKKSASLDLKEASFHSQEVDIQAEGNVEFQLLHDSPYFQLGAHLNIDATNCLKNQYQVHSISPACFIYSPNEGWNVVDSDFSICLSDGEEIGHAHLPIAALFEKDAILKLQNAHLLMDSKALQRELVTFPMFKDLSKDEIPISTNSKTECYLTLDLLQDELHASGAFPASEYEWRKKKLPLDFGSFDYKPGKLNLTIGLPVASSSYLVSADIDLDERMETHVDVWPFLDKEIVDRSKKSLYLNCRLKEDDGFVIHRLCGDLLGCRFSFHPKYQMQDSYSSVLLGYLDIDAKGLYPILPQEMQEVVDSLQLHKGIGLMGEITLNKESLAASFFEGSLTGKDFDLLGYQVKSLLGHVHGSIDHIYLQDLKVTDDAFICAAPEIDLFEKTKGDWHLRMPEFLISDLRPSLLRKNLQSYQRIKPFQLKRMVFNEVAGSLMNKELLTGKGSLSFVNTFKREHNLLDIPKEIISRIGLDPVLLVPIQGEMDFFVKEGKILFNKLKNSFSESKRSYFYLSNKSDSYLDFNGNLHIDIRMKQHVLFKITQLFTLSIEGTLNKPRYFLK